MFRVERATSDDFERIYPLLRQGFGSAIPEQIWKRIFVPPWNSPETFCGYSLLENEVVKGYLGLIFSSRVIDERVEKFCNMTSWYVRDDCRSHSLALLLEALKLKDYTFTNFTASPTVATILSRLGFTEFPVHQQVLFPLPHLRGTPRRWGCDFDSQVSTIQLTQTDGIIFADHQGLDCRHVLLKSNDAYCYLVLKETRRKGLPFAKVHYLSHAEHFIAGIESVMVQVCRRLRVLGIMVDERYLKGHKFKTGIRYPHQRRAYFKSSSSALSFNQIDTLYSELVLLHS